jgi:hypothetical protein
MDYYTQTGPRPELAAVEVNPPEGYIGSQILPNVPVTDKSGTVYYATVTADSAAETGRGAGVAPTGVQISDSTTTFTAAECIARGKVTPDEAKQFGGIDKADIAGTKWAKRQVMNSRESAICTLILGKAASATFDAAKVLTQVQTGLEAVRLYDGPSALITSTMTFKKIVLGLLGDSKMGPLFSRLVTGTSSAVAAQGLSYKAWVDAFAMFIGVDQVKIGCDSIWNAAAVAGKFGIAKLDDGNDAMSHKWKPVLGKTWTFLPDGTNEYEIQSVGDRITLNNLYDAKSWYNAKLLNTGALYVMDGAV